MPKGIIFHMPTLVYALLYTAVLFGAVKWALGDLLLVATAIVILAIVSALAGRLIARHFFFAIVPVMLSVAALSLIFFIDAQAQQYIIIGLMGFLVYGVTLGSYRLSKEPRDAVARGMVIAGATTAVFFSYAATFAFHLNFLVPLWWIAGIIFIITTVLSWQYFVMIARGLFVQTVVYSIVLGMILTQAAVSAMYWPFGYLTISIILLMIYYILWDLGQSFFLERLSKIRIITNIVFFLCLAGSVLITAQWLPLV